MVDGEFFTKLEVIMTPFSQSLKSKMNIGCLKELYSLIHIIG